MLTQTRKLWWIAAVLAVFVAGAMMKTAGAAQADSSSKPAFTPQSPNVVAGENEAKKLLVLMDADKSGTVSKQEFMAFMEAEFDRLDTNHDGVLDVKELEQSQLVQTRRGGGHR